MTDACASYYDDNGCLIVPECPAVAPVPAHIDRSPVIGWNAGANSIDALTGDVFARFSMPAGVTGAYLGLKGSRERQTLPTGITHGFYFQRGLAGDQFQVVELGQTKTVLATRATDDAFEVRRVGATVTYYRNGAPVYTSEVPSSGSVLVNACLYTSGDGVE